MQRFDSTFPTVTEVDEDPNAQTFEKFINHMVNEDIIENTDPHNREFREEGYNGQRSPFGRIPVMVLDPIEMEYLVRDIIRAYDRLGIREQD